MRLTRHRLLVVAIAAAHGVAVLFIGLWPTHVDAGLHGPLDATISWFHRHGIRWLDYGIIERSANIALFIPFGALVTLLVGIRRWWLAVLLGVGASAVIEASQYLLLPSRTPSLGDVAMNSVGALIGASVTALVAVARGATSRRQRPMPR